MTAPEADASATPSRPPVPPIWKWTMRVSGVIAMALFLLPTFYVLKYNLVDASRERDIVKRLAPEDDGQPPALRQAKVDKLNVVQLALNARDPDDIPLLTAIARRDSDADVRMAAILAIGLLLKHPAVNFLRPMETLQAKSTLADLAVNADPIEVRHAAQDALGMIAQGGVVVRRQ